MTEPLITPAARKQRILAVVLPHLLCELALQRLPTAPSARPAGQLLPGARSALRTTELPRAIVVVDSSLPQLDGKTELDAVNSAAYQLGVRPRQTIGQASAIVEGLNVHALPRACVFSSLKHIAEVALRFGSPVSFQAPDTVWVDVSGSSHLYESERELGLELTAQIKALGHAPRVAVANGPWLAQSFARYAQLEEAGILLVDSAHTARSVGQLPIIALPIHREAASWFSRLGLLSIEDLRAVPASSLAARLEGQVLDVAIGSVLDLIRGQDDGILIPHHPEEVPREELFWEDPLENVEPLLFVLKGLSGRLSARLEGRGQAAQEVLLTIHYDRSIAALVTPDGKAVPDTKSLSFKLASPLFHAEDLERVMRLRLQRQSLMAPTLGLSLQATAVTDARYCQMGLSEASDWRSGISQDPRAASVLVAELSADIGAECVGLLVTEDSHLLEKSSVLLPLRASSWAGVSSSGALSSGALSSGALSSGALSSGALSSEAMDICEGTWARGMRDAALGDAALEGVSLPRSPTRLLDPPIEIHAPIRKHELWVVREQAFVVSDIHFEQRLEGIEWWDRMRVFRDYFRVWLAPPNSKLATAVSRDSRGGVPRASGGLEALVYWDREQGKSYLQALYD